MISPTKTVIIQGLHSLYLRGLRTTLDLKIFLAPAIDVRINWKTQRDQRERGYTPDAIRESILKRENDSNLHIAPQRQFADWIIEYQSEPTVIHTLWNDAPIGPLLDSLVKVGECNISYVNTMDIDRIGFSIAGEPPVETIALIADEIFESLRQVTRSRANPEWKPGFDGVNQLIMLALLEDRIFNQPTGI